MFPNIPLPEPLGSGWTHTFNDFLVPIVESQGVLLYRVDGYGHETLYERSGPAQWSPRTPGELRGRETVTLSGGQYRLTTLDGTVTAFSAGSGLWLSTTDRWGNSITGAYSGANLATITDSVGRVVTLSYSGATLTTITLPTGESWRFAGSQLSAIYDPMHTGSTPWRTISYLADSRGLPRLLHEMSDESGHVIAGHEYDALERGRASYAEGGRDRMTVTYGALGAHTARVVTTIDSTIGQTQTSDFTFSYQRGRFLPTRITGSCASCGGAESEAQSFTYDANNRVASAVDGSGHVQRFTYDPSGNLLTRVEAAGTPKERTTRFEYAHPGWSSFVTKIIEPSAAKPGAQKVTAFAWAAGETLLTRTDSGFVAATDVTPRVHVSTIAFDGRHRVTSTDGPRTDVTDVESIAYYPDDDATLTRRGRARRSTDALGLSEEMEDYDVYGRARRVTDADGVTTQLTTDARGRVTASTIEPVAGDANESAAYTSTQEFDGRDRLVRATTARGHGLAYAYEDGTGRILATIRLDDAGRQHERQLTTRNDIGGMVREEDQLCASPAPVCTSWITKRFESFTYDAHNRLAERRHAAPAGAKTIFAYNRDGHLQSVQDENHTAPNVRYAYDELGRPISVTRTLAGAPGGVAAMSFDYDAMDNLISVTDANGNVTRSSYDDFGRLTRQESPVTGTTTNEYDPAGNLLSATDARGATTSYTFDATGRTLTSTSTLGGTSESVTYTYDDDTPGIYGAGRVTSMTDPSGSTSYAYDRRGLLRREMKTILGDTYTTSFEYDANANRRAIVYPTGRRAEYAYDFADRPVSLTGALGGSTRSYVTNTTYLPFGPELAQMRPGGLSRNAAYDARYRLMSFDVRAGAASLADLRYANDAAGNITTIADALDPRYNRSFRYDDLDRLTHADTGPALWGSATWNYDPIGNRLSSTLGARVSTYVYRSSGAAVTSQLGSVTESGRTRTVDYDAAGNEQRVGSAAFAWSPRNQLAQADGIRYLYDGRALRVAQVGVSIGPLITTQPASQPVCPGGSAVLTVTASAATSYQWQSSNDGASWIDVVGATSRTLTVTPTAPTHYRVIASNSAASTSSDAATITPTALGIEPQSGIRYGDVTNDGSVDDADVASLRATLAGLQPLGVPQPVADLDGNGSLDAVDLSLLGGYAGGTVNCLPQFPSLVGMTSAASLELSTEQTGPNPTQYFFYSPEFLLLAQTEIRAGGGTPSIAIEYLWFNGKAVAEERLAPAETRFTFTDHLGTPFLQTNLAGTPVWRVEYEPFGDVFTTRNGSAADQRLRFPGQELDDQSPERAYNIFRWYRSGWGRYTQGDRFLPIRSYEPNLYAYTGDNPLRFADPKGLYRVDPSCDCGQQVNIGKTMAESCRYLKNPKCTTALHKYTLIPFRNRGRKEPLDDCMKRRCSAKERGKGPLIVCSNGTDQCGWTAPNGDIVLYKGNDGCPRIVPKGKGPKGPRDYSQTLFHETIHTCGWGPKHTTEFYELTQICTGWGE
ncbi:MAG TPA: RHS repeat-associated core domain-containing protein [Thermoanaerobaculia bacterium]|nr:RHS repeat-associated core domain-containing protein [Thermoanaerobaculia bacterium]